jgi:O-antigen/teichoic acid export membrane protein
MSYETGKNKADESHVTDNVFLHWISKLYQYIFHEEMSADVRVFFKSLLYVGVGTIILTLFSTVYTILGGRMLGPEEYGKFVLIQSVAMFLYIPMILGFCTAMLKYTSEKDEVYRQSSIISVTYILVFLFTLFFATIFIICRMQLSHLFSISPDLFFFSLVFAIIYVFYMLNTSVLQGLHKAKTYAYFQIIFAVILLILFFSFIFNNRISFKSMIFPGLIAYGLSGLLILTLYARKYIKIRLVKEWTKVLIKYAVYAVISSVSYVFFSNIDKIMINKYLSIADVGIYNAYFIGSFNTISILWSLFNTIFFPSISKYQDKGKIFLRINKLIPYLIGLGIPLTLFSQFLVLLIFGSQYPVNLLLMAILALSAVLMVIFGLNSWTFASQGLTGIKLANIGNIILAIFNVGLSIYLIPRLGLYGAGSAITISYCAGIFCLYFLKRKIL